MTKRFEKPELSPWNALHAATGRNEKVVMLTCANTGEVLTIFPAVDTVYNVRDKHGSDSISDAVWVAARDLCAPASNPRADNAPKEDAPLPIFVDVEDVIAELPLPIAPPEAPAPKKGKKL